MLIEFTVENFGSFREPQRLEMAPAENIRALPGHCFDSGLSKHPQQLLRSAVVYGPNASGKTHWVKAAVFMRDMILNSNRKKVEEPIGANPFLLDLKTLSEPSAFQMIFVVEGRRHQYGFKVDKQRVWSEWCYIFSDREEEVTSFRRVYDPDQDMYHVETQAWEGLEEPLHDVPEDWLALSQFGQGKKQRWPELVATYRWFQHQLHIIHLDAESSRFDTLELCKTSEGRDWVLRFLKAADLGVEDISFKTIDEMPSDVRDVVLRDFKENPPPWLSEDDRTNFKQSIDATGFYAFSEFGIQLGGGSVRMVRTIPRTGESVPFRIEMESTGTQKMFDLAARWKDFLSTGQVFFVDEIEAGLHHRLVRFLLELIHDPERNSHGSQLIATTHDTALLDDQLFRPDQIWLMQKNREHASHMSPLSDFDIDLKEGETLQKFYLDGLYGAVPMVRTRRVPVSLVGDEDH